MPRIIVRSETFQTTLVAPRIGWTPRVPRCYTPNTSHSSTLKYFGDTFFPASCVISSSIFFTFRRQYSPLESLLESELVVLSSFLLFLFITLTFFLKFSPITSVSSGTKKKNDINNLRCPWIPLDVNIRTKVLYKALYESFTRLVVTASG